MFRGKRRNWAFLPIMLLIFALVLAACDDGGSDDGDTGSDTGTETEETEEVTEDSEETEEATDEGDTDSDTDDAAAGGNWEGPIVFGDYNWGSAMWHNRVAQYIAEHGYGYETDTVPGSTTPLVQGMVDNDVQVSMEIWLQNMPDSYHEDVEAGELVDLGPNYVEAVQGWWVPTYMIEGDEERGIEPTAPDLAHVDDLPQYAHLFEDPEAPDKGRIYNGVGGWEATEITGTKLDAYGLSDDFRPFLPGSQAALFTSLDNAYEAGEAWIGYIWTPSWPSAQYDLTLIEEPEYSDECWNRLLEAAAGDAEAEGGCAFPEVEVNVVVSPEFAEGAPEVAEFLTNYETTEPMTSEALLWMTENDETPDATAIWWLQGNEDTWSEWVPEDVAADVSAALENE